MVPAGKDCCALDVFDQFFLVFEEEIGQNISCTQLSIHLPLRNSLLLHPSLLSNRFWASWSLPGIQEPVLSCTCEQKNLFHSHQCFISVSTGNSTNKSTSKGGSATPCPACPCDSAAHWRLDCHVCQLLRVTGSYHQEWVELMEN